MARCAVGLSLGGYARCGEMLAQPPASPEEKHPVIGDQRPERVLEGQRQVIFDLEMPRPGKGVRADKPESDPPQIAGREYQNKRRQPTDRRAIMQRPAKRHTVRAQIDWPEFGKAVGDFAHAAHVTGKQGIRNFGDRHNLGFLLKAGGPAFC